MGPVTDFSNFMSAVIDQRAFAKLSGAIDRAHRTGRVSDMAGGPTTTPVLRAHGGGQGKSDQRVLHRRYFAWPAARRVRLTTAAMPAVVEQMENIAKYALTDRSSLGTAPRSRRPGDLRFAAGGFYIATNPQGRSSGSPFGGGARLGHQRQGGGGAEPDTLDEHGRSGETFVPPTDLHTPHEMGRL